MPASSLTVSDASIIEGNAGTQNAVIMVNLASPTTKTVTVDYSTANGSASAGSDYKAVSGKLTFTPGQTSKSILVPVIGDRLAGPNETFSVNLSRPSNAVIADGQGTVTIVDDEPRISVNDVSGLEGNSGTTLLTMTVSLSAVYDAPVTVTFATQNGTALAGEDYQAASGTLTFAPGVTSKPITVQVIGDATPEFDETYYVNLSGASANALISDGQGVGTIIDDEPRMISIDDVSGLEGNSGTTPFTFTVNLSAASSAAVTVNYATQNGTALAGEDYLAAAGTLTFAPGETSRTITVQVNGDVTPETDETFFVNLSGASSNAVIADGQGVGTIVDDDRPSIGISNEASGPEGNSGTTPFTFTVRLSAASSAAVTVNFATHDYTAIAGEDYLAASGTLTFAPGETSKTFTVQVIGDTTPEEDELFQVNLSGATNAVIAPYGGWGAGVIENDDWGICNWGGGGGDFNWNNPLNWSTDSLPGPFDDVVIGADFSSITVSYNESGTTHIHSLASAANVALFGGTFTLSAGSSINGDLTISGCDLTVCGELTVTGQLMNSGGLRVLTRVLVFGDYTQTAAAFLDVTPPSAFSDGVSLWIGGTARLDGVVYVNAPFWASFQVLTCDSRIGDFAAYIAPNYWGDQAVYSWYWEGNSLWITSGIFW